MIAPIAFEAMTMLVKWEQYRFVRSDLLLIDEGRLGGSLQQQIAEATDLGKLLLLCSC